jgi:chemotaxis protein methyltransferase CheR
MTLFSTELTPEEFERFCNLIYKVSGIRMPNTKRVLVTNRVRRRLRATGYESFAAYYTFLTSPAGSVEMPRFLDEVTTNETFFYRDGHHFDWFGDVFLPGILQSASLRKRPKTLRVWSAAASTGEELYSMALKVAARSADFAGWRVTLLGTDLSGAVLDAARAGNYDARAVRLVKEEDRRRFFDVDPAGERWTVKPAVRALTKWKSHNLLKPIDEEPFDCIFLKNVLIYFDSTSKHKVVDNMVAALAKEGYLVTGPSEGIFTMLGALTRHKTWLYQKPG